LPPLLEGGVWGGSLATNADHTQSAPVLLYLHGNSSNIGDAVHRADLLHQLGMSVLLIDYRGYGKSTGPFPNETRLYEDAEAAFHYLIHRRNIAPANIFVYGHSLGGAIAIELAVRHPQMAGAILEATFTSMEEMLDYVIPYQIFPKDWILTQKFASLTKVRSLQIPILFIHGMEDKTIPVQMSRTCSPPRQHPKSCYWCPPQDITMGQSCREGSIGRQFWSLSDMTSIINSGFAVMDDRILSDIKPVCNS